MSVSCTGFSSSRDGGSSSGSDTEVSGEDWYVEESSNGATDSSKREWGPSEVVEKGPMEGPGLGMAKWMPTSRDNIAHSKV